MSESNIADDLRRKFEESIKETITNSKQFQAEKFKRNRVLDMETMVKAIHLFRGGSLSKELHELSIPATASAFVQRRKKLSSMLFEEILSVFNGKCDDPELYHGLRVMAVDGTGVNLARDPKATSTFIQNVSNPKGYNQMHACCIYDVLNKTYHSCSINRDEIGALLYALDWYEFDRNTLFVADRGYESYNLFATFIEKGYFFLNRVKQNKSSMKKIAELPMKTLDTDLSFTITTTQTKEDKEKGHILVQVQKNKDRIYSPNTRAGRFDYPTPYVMRFRVVRFMLDTGEYETLVTNLPRGKNGFSSEDLAELYHSRWGIETSFSELKYGIGLNLLHGKSEEFARQELYAALTISNFCSRVAREVVIQKKSETAYAYKVNQKMAIYLCRKFLTENTMTGEQLMKEIARYTEPVRPGRSDERNIKPKSFSGFTYRIAA